MDKKYAISGRCEVIHASPPVAFVPLSYIVITFFFIKYEFHNKIKKKVLNIVQGLLDFMI